MPRPCGRWKAPDLSPPLLDVLGETLVACDLQQSFLMLAGRSLRGHLTQRPRLLAVESGAVVLLVGHGIEEVQRTSDRAKGSSKKTIL